MKKFFNFRPALFFTLFFSFGIFMGFISIKYSFTSLAAITVVLAVAAVSCYFVHKIPLKFFRIKNALSFLYGYRRRAAAFAITFLFGAAMFFLSFSGFGSSAGLDGKMADVQGNVIETYKKTEGGGYYFLLEKVYFTIGGTPEKAEGKVSVYVSGSCKDSLPQTGDMLFFTSRIKVNRIFEKGRINTYAYRNNICYSFFIGENNYISAKDKPSVFVAVKNHIKNTLYGNLRENNAEICYALVTGDSLLMDSGIKQAFFKSGIAHVFSVSGLHIGVLSASVIFILNKLRVKKIPQIIITSAILLFYSGVCNFSPSVLRAFLMTEIYLFSVAAGRKYDPLSSLSAAVIIILVLSPLMLFDAGFLLSVSSVAGIFLLNKKIGSLFKFLPSFIRQPFTLSLSAQAGMLPVIAFCFKELPVFSLVLNFLAIPLVNIAYIALLTVLAVSAALPFVSFFYFVPQGLTEGVKIMVNTANSSGFTSFNAVMSWAGAAFYYAAMLALSGFVFIKASVKIIVALLCAFVFTATAALSGMPFNYAGTSVSSLCLNGGKISLITCGGKVYYIHYGNGKEDISEIQNYLEQNNIKDIEAAFFIQEGNFLAKQAELLKQYNAKKIILPYNADNSHSGLSEFEAETKVKYLLSKEAYIYENLQFSAYYYNGNYCAGIVSINNFNVMYVCDIAKDALNYIFNNMYLRINIVFADGEYGFIGGALNPGVFVTGEYYSSKLYGNIYSTAVYGHLIFDVKDDKIIRKYGYRQELFV